MPAARSCAVTRLRTLDRSHACWPCHCRPPCAMVARRSTATDIVVRADSPLATLEVSSAGVSPITTEDSQSGYQAARLLFAPFAHGAAAAVRGDGRAAGHAATRRRGDRRGRCGRGTARQLRSRPPAPARARVDGATARRGQHPAHVDAAAGRGTGNDGRPRAPSHRRAARVADAVDLASVRATLLLTRVFGRRSSDLRRARR